jgi:hypothetical protein
LDHSEFLGQAPGSLKGTDAWVRHVAENAWNSYPPRAESKLADAQPKRRWFSFSLRSLLGLVWILSLPMAWLSWQWSLARDRFAMRKQIEVECGDSIPPFNSIARDHDVRAYYDAYLPKRKATPKSNSADAFSLHYQRPAKITPTRRVGSRHESRRTT